MGHPDVGALGRVREGAAHRRRASRSWRAASRASIAIDWQRFLLVDAPLSPFRTGRQPQESDRASYTLPDD